MKRTTIKLALVLVLALSSVSCRDVQAVQQAESIARTASEGVGIIGKTARGARGAPILVLGERHDSRAGQIQHAITMVRLHDQFGLRHIALEGYLKEDPKITTDWFVEAAGGDLAAQRQVAVQLLQEGEISSAEFMALAFDDIELHPSEIGDEYYVSMGEEAANAPLVYLYKIAGRSVKPRHHQRIKELQDAIERAATDEEQAEGVRAFLDYLMSLDPWTEEQYEALLDDSPENLTAERRLALVQKIDQRARQLSVDLEPAEKAAMQENLAFWKGRSGASDTMVGVATVLADRSGVTVVTMQVGAAHTDRIGKLLQAENRSYAVVTPQSFEQNEGDMPHGMYQRKDKGLSVYMEGFMKTLEEAFPADEQKKPKPVLNKPWAQANAEFRLLSHKLASRMLTLPPNRPPPPPPQGPLSPGDAFPDGERFQGKWIYIDPRSVAIVPAQDDQDQYSFMITAETIDALALVPLPGDVIDKLRALQDQRVVGEANFEALLRNTLGEAPTEEHRSWIVESAREKAVLFRVELNPNDAARRKELWVKAGRTTGLVSKRQREDAEALLQKALSEVQAQNEMSNTVEDQEGRIQVSKEIIVGFAPTRAVAAKIRMGS